MPQASAENYGAAPARARERRHSARRRASSPCVVQFLAPQLPEALLIDAGTEGAALRLYGRAKRGSRCRLRFHLSPGATAEVEAEFVWLRQEAAGVRFLDVPQASRQALQRWVASPALPFLPDQELPRRQSAIGAMAARLREQVQADGVAIALREGERIVCRVSVGKAPPVGAVLNGGEGLSGLCLRSGTAVICHDSDTDERVDAAAWQAMGVRAAAIVPVANADGAAGLVEVMWSAPAQATAARISALEAVAEALAPVETPVPPTLKEEISPMRIARSTPAAQRRIVMGVLAIALLFAGGWLVGGRLARRVVSAHPQPAGRVKLVLGAVAIVRPEALRFAALTPGDMSTPLAVGYPEVARARGVSGEVVLLARIETDGSVPAVQAVSGNNELVQAASAALSRSHWRPFIAGGGAVCVDAVVRVQFVLAAR